MRIMKVMRIRTCLPLILAAALAACSGRGAKNVISATGTIEATEVNVASKVAGQLERLAVDEGAVV
ncbi:MAG: hypothetical protein ABFD80_12240, partial [Acidobacteriota bacterium]